MPLYAAGMGLSMRAGRGVAEGEAGKCGVRNSECGVESKGVGK